MIALVPDTSVWINLLATEKCDAILAALNASCEVPEQVLREVTRDPVTQRLYSNADHPLLKSPNVRVVALSDPELSTFVDLVSGANSARLGDGEAACIARVRSNSATLAIDERKARRIVRERYPEMDLCSSFEILEDSELLRVLGHDVIAECLHSAIHFGGMHRVG